MNKAKLIIGIIAIIAGIAFIGMGFLPKNEEVKVDIDSWNRLSTGTGLEVTGTVVATEADIRSEGSRRTRTIDTVYCPVYEYTVGGTAHRVTAIDNCEMEESAVQIGATGPILYDPSAPAVSFVKTTETEKYYADLSAFPVVNVVAGAFIAFLGVLAILNARPKTPEEISKRAEEKRKSDEEIEKLIDEVDNDKRI